MFWSFLVQLVDYKYLFQEWRSLICLVQEWVGTPYLPDRLNSCHKIKFHQRACRDLTHLVFSISQWSHLSQTSLPDYAKCVQIVSGIEPSCQHLARKCFSQSRWRFHFSKPTSVSASDRVQRHQHPMALTASSPWCSTALMQKNWTQDTCVKQLVAFDQHLCVWCHTAHVYVSSAFLRSLHICWP